MLLSCAQIRSILCLLLLLGKGSSSSMSHTWVFEERVWGWEEGRWRTDLFSLSCFFFFSSYFLFVLCRITIWLETYMDSHGGTSTEALFLGGLSWKYFPPPVSFFLYFFRCQLCALFSWAHSQQAKNTRPTANRHKTQGPRPIGTKNSAYNQQVQKIGPTANRHKRPILITGTTKHLRARFAIHSQQAQNTRPTANTVGKQVIDRYLNINQLTRRQILKCNITCLP